jgi:hypothetical protein
LAPTSAWPYRPRSHAAQKSRVPAHPSWDQRRTIYIQVDLNRLGGPRAGPGHSGGRRSVAFLAVLAAAIAPLTAACAPSATYLGSSSLGLYFKVPPTWQAFGTPLMKRLGLPSTSGASAAQAQGASYFAYTSLASDNARLGSSGLTGNIPWAMGIVQDLGSKDQDDLSLQSLEDQIFNPDGISQQGGQVTQLAPIDVIVKGALRGTRVAYDISSQDGSLDFEQVSLTNTPTSRVWALLVGCSPSCFRREKPVLARIIASFTVTAPGS